MSKTSLITVIILVALAVIGWFTLLGDTSSTENKYKDAVETGDKWCEMGLYLRSTRKYREAIEIDSNEKVWEKMINAYALAYEEEPEEVESEYKNTLIEALAVSPGNYSYASELADIYVKNNNYAEAYNCLYAVDVYGINEKRDQDELEAKMREIRYSYKISGREYEDFQSYSGGYYTVMKRDSFGNEIWSVEGAANTVNVDKEHAYIGMISDEAVRVMTQYDPEKEIIEEVEDSDEKIIIKVPGESRIRDKDNVTLGIFSDVVEWAGIYADDRLPAKLEGNDYYAYYDSFAEEVIGEFEAVGTFRDGKAAVCKDEKWYIIDIEGDKQGDEYYDIKLDTFGYYNSNDIIVAAEKEGEYCLYNNEWEKIGKFECDDIDICTADKLIAFKEDDKWGFVNAEGDVVIDPEYSDAKSFSNGLAAVCIDGTWGFIDEDNNLVIDNIFADADYFNDAGVCMVKAISRESTDDENPLLVWTTIGLRIIDAEK